MRYFPVFLDLKGRRCVVVGGGRVAERKVKNLLKAQARVEVISPELTASLSRMAREGKIRHHARPYRKKDLKGAFLAIAATDDRAANERVFREASASRLPVNVVDDPAHSTFIVPAVVQKKDLLLAVSTSGRSPALARLIRRKLEREIGPEYPRLVKLLGRVRGKVIARGLGPGQNQKIFRRLLEEDLLPLIKEKNGKELERRLCAVLGPGFSLKELGFKW